ncbi:MAG TPA: DUF3857 domain-containing protein [Terriglobales bacterium]|nr:DUF3857 domain-containing protein [Terriglobales bacterium]
MSSRTIAILLVALLSVAQGQDSPKTAETKPDVAAPVRSAFFPASNLEATVALANAALRRNPANSELLFLKMEAHALQADTENTLSSAIRLCAVAERNDPRASIAAARIRHLAGNTQVFRNVIPRVHQLIADNSPCVAGLRNSLIAAEMEGAPGIDLDTQTREAGIITHWRVQGPFGKYSNVAFDQSWQPERDGVAEEVSDKPSERLQFDDGNFQLPDYFPRSGVYYAAATLNLPRSARRILRIESAGTLEIFLNRRRVLRNDLRFRKGPEVVSQEIKIPAKPQAVLVKFTPQALPFRVSVLPISSRQQGQPEMDPVESSYVTALQQYWVGNFPQAAVTLAELRKSTPSTAADFLFAQTLARSFSNSPHEASLLESALSASPDATAINFRLAEKARMAGRIDEAWRRINEVLEQRPEFVPGIRLAVELALSRKMTSEAGPLYDRLLKLTPTCAVIAEAYKFSVQRNNFQNSSRLLRDSETCAPGSTTSVELHSIAGDHESATAAAEKVVRTHPLSREARFLLVRELVLAGKTAQATQAAKELAAIAPNSKKFRDLAVSPMDPTSFADDQSDAGSLITDSAPFYATYRRDALALIRETKQRTDSGPAIMLLDDKVAHVAEDGTVSVYYHKVLKILTRAGVSSYGEVSIPENSQILELRTIAADGTVSEPEFHQHKTTISMPGLLPGSVIDQEYVIRYPHRAGLDAHGPDFVFTFGSFKMPVLLMRFVSLTPTSLSVAARELNGAPRARISTDQRTRVQIWESQDAPSRAMEPSLPSREVLPTVAVIGIPEGGWADVRDYYREVLINASQSGTRSALILNQLRLQGRNDAESLLRIFEYVSSRIRSDGSSFKSGTPRAGEDTLETGYGNRTAALLALASAAGFDPDMVLARDVSSFPPVVSRHSFTNPLVMIKSGNSTFLLDAETENIGFNAIPPTDSRRDALHVPRVAPDVQPLIGLGASVSELSLADADIRVTPAGDLLAQVTIKLGANRSRQMRNSLETVDALGYRQFLQQIASRIFPGATDTTGDIRYLHDLQQPLELSFRCRVPGFLDLSSSRIDTDQLAPTLGLRRLYANVATRNFPLYVDTPLVERTTFRVTLPSNVRLARRTPNRTIQSRFGRYAFATRDVGKNSFEIVREFDIPVQVVSTEDYKDFMDFADRIDAVERQRFTFSAKNAVAQADLSGIR